MVTPTGGEGGVASGCMVTPRWGRGWVAWSLLAGEVGFRLLPAGEIGFQGFFPLGERVGCMVIPTRGEGGLHSYSPLGERVGAMVMVSYHWGS